MTMITALLAFGAITLFAVGFEILYTYGTQGFGYGFSSNRPQVTLTPLGQRINRAYENQVEASAYVVPILGAAAIAGLDTPLAQNAALAIILGRAWFVFFYYTGLPFVRILGFVCGSMGSLVIAVLLAQAIAAYPF